MLKESQRVVSSLAYHWGIHFIHHDSLPDVQLSQGVQATVVSLVNRCGRTPLHSNPLADIHSSLESRSDNTMVPTRYVPCQTSKELVNNKHLLLQSDWFTDIPVEGMKTSQV